MFSSINKNIFYIFILITKLSRFIKTIRLTNAHAPTANHTEYLEKYRFLSHKIKKQFLFFKCTFFTGHQETRNVRLSPS